MSNAALFSSTCASVAAFGIAHTPSCASTQAIATCAGVTECRSATRRNTGSPTSRPCSIGEYAITGNPC